MKYVIGIDVGTGSARAGLFDETGKMHATASHPISIHHPQPEWAEQSTQNIWESICKTVRQCLEQSSVPADAVAALSYSATCSLVLLDNDDNALPLGEEADDWNIIVWMDHRAVAEADEITRSKSKVLNNVGGIMSPEMEIPKLMWLKRNRPELWAKLGFAGDLADYLAYRSSGSVQRSVCTVGCKWTYDPDSASWNEQFLSEMGLDDLLEKSQTPEQAVPIGTPLGPLTPQSAKELGLTTNCQVAAGLIDAHSGALGTLGLFSDDRIGSRMALIAGTSNCHIALSPERTEVPGIWGPYGGAVLDGMWCTEGGQSVTGALLDHIIKLMGSDRLGSDPHGELGKIIKERVDRDHDFAATVEVIPDFIGNRAPFADPELRGAIHGLTIEDPWETLQKVYWAAAAGIAYGTRMIIDQLNACGYEIDTIHLSGGHKKSDLLIDLYADATQCKVLTSDAEEPVLLGAAIAALQQFEQGCSVTDVTSKMKFEHQVRTPRDAFRDVHEKRYAKFLSHYQQQGYSLKKPSVMPKIVAS